ncbi:MAG: DUF3800 domain-containing protein [Actinomycetota bacterium]
MGFTYFLDDAGDSRLKGKGDYWVLGGIVLPDETWPHLRTGMDAVRAKWQIPAGQELKWSDVWSRWGQLKTLNLLKKFSKPASVSHIASRPQLVQLVGDQLDVVAADSGIRIICVYCVKAAAMNVCQYDPDPDERCYRDMFQDAIERYEYLLRGAGIYGSIVIDQKSGKLDKVIRETAADLLVHGTRFTNIERVVDGLSVNPSSLSYGLQMSDFVVGALHTCLRNDIAAHALRVRANFHRKADGTAAGAGIKRYPSGLGVLEAQLSALN